MFASMGTFILGLRANAGVCDLAPFGSLRGAAQDDNVGAGRGAILGEIRNFPARFAIQLRKGMAA
jgi:hypothetical protein